MTPSEAQRVAVLCDFDGTITIGDVIEAIYRRFADEHCWALVVRWIRGEITTPQEMHGCFSRIKASREEMESVLDTVQIDPGFAELVVLCRRQGYLLAILSDGLEWYIRHILGRYGPFGGLPIYANTITFSQDGVQITTPWYAPATPRRGVSKPTIIRKYQAEGYRVIFIGDGLSDVEAVSAADRVYARDRLLAYCREQNIPAVAFSNLGELVRKWAV